MREQTHNTPRRPAAQAEAVHPTGPTGSADLRAEVEGWSQVARDAFERLQRGADAELELERRRNDSGQ